MTLRDRLPWAIDHAPTALRSSLPDVGAGDPIINGFVICGPVLVLLSIWFGRTVATTALASLYVLSFVAYVLYKGT